MSPKDTAVIPQHELVFSGQQLFDWETKYTFTQLSDFCRRHDLMPWIAVSAYLVLLWIGMRVMRRRTPLGLKVPLFVWNISLSLFSIAGLVRMQQEFRYTMAQGGWRGTYCSKSTDNVVAFWIFVFVMSKFVEFGDTLFLVLRKKPVIFLHWYHHITVLLFSYFTAIDWSANGRWFVTMNYFVHSLMYAYYALQAAGIRVPRVMAMPLTVMQILQMFGGIYVITMSAMEEMAGHEKTCLNSRRTLISGLVMYASYLVLFVNFFLQSYVFGKKKRQPTSVHSNHSNGQKSEINGNTTRSKRD